MTKLVSDIVSSLVRTFFLTTFLLALLTVASFANDEPWTDLKEELFGTRTVTQTEGGFVLYAPKEAPDAAIVPISVRFPHTLAQRLKSVTLVVDRNPAPVAATITFGDTFRTGLDVGERLIATRVRVDSFSYVRAIAELTNGDLIMSKAFVMGAGGCSAPSSKDLEAALADLGQIRIKVIRNQQLGDLWRETRVMVRHPNFSGMQMDAKSGTYTPARFVEDLEIRKGGKVIFRVAGGISLSENPMVRFTYGAKIDHEIAVRVKDSDGATFTHDGRGT